MHKNSIFAFLTIEHKCSSFLFLKKGTWNSHLLTVLNCRHHSASLKTSCLFLSDVCSYIVVWSYALLITPPFHGNSIFLISPIGFKQIRIIPRRACITFVIKHKDGVLSSISTYPNIQQSNIFKQLTVPAITVVSTIFTNFICFE